MKITVKGQVTIPKPIRDQFGLYPGTEVRITERQHQVVVEKAHAAHPLDELYGLLGLRQRTDRLITAMRGKGV